MDDAECRKLVIGCQFFGRSHGCLQTYDWTKTVAGAKETSQVSEATSETESFTCFECLSTVDSLPGAPSSARNVDSEVHIDVHVVGNSD